uniref:CRAL-TRIO domain-containing protein n=1 Tax=Heterorhabditis bacteriophora TaxID=37862 RepID=A0A1I7XIT3_HETBA
MHQLIMPEPFSEEIMKTAKILRATLDIPSCLDSPFFIARFLRANNGDVELSKQRISEYLTHRKTLGYADYDDLGIFTKFPIGKATFERFRISLIDYDIRSKDVHVFIQKMEGTDIKEIMKVIPLSYVLHSYYCLHENFGRAVAHTEKKTGLNIADFLNPLSSPVKLARLVVKIWSEYFSENLCKLLIINPPGIVSLMWQISKCIMDTRTASRLAFLHDVEELKHYLEPEAIPVEYGGLWRDDSGYADPPEGCCRKNKPTLGSEHKGPDEIWTINGILKPPSSKTYNIKAHQQVEILRYMMV